MSRRATHLWPDLSAVLGVALLLALGLALLTGCSRSPADATPVAAPADAPVADLVLRNETTDHIYDRALRASIRIFQQRTQIQLGVIIDQKLPPQQTIENYAAQAFKQFKMGETAAGKGILLVWLEQEQLFKIEVGYALEGVFPDALCHRLEGAARTFMLSHSAFARRDFLTELIVTMGLHYLDYRKSGQVSDPILPSATPGHTLTRYLSGGAGLVGRGYAASALQAQSELVALSPEAAQEMQGDPSPDVVLARYLDSLDRGIGAPQLPLLTEGSRFFRINKPHAPQYLQRMGTYYRKAQPYSLLIQGDWAAALFPPTAPVMPILLRKNALGRWQVDEARAWVYFHLAEDGSSVPKYADSPWAFAWQAQAGRAAQQPVYFDRSTTPRPLPLPTDLPQKLALAEQALARNLAQASAYLSLAELLHFEMYWIEAAAPLYEKVLELSPQRDDIRWRLLDVYLNTSDINALERQYLALIKRTPNDALLQHYYAWFKKNYD